MNLNMKVVTAAEFVCCINLGAILFASYISSRGIAEW
jgi:hypothetical protein